MSELRKILQLLHLLVSNKSVRTGDKMKITGITPTLWKLSTKPVRPFGLIIYTAKINQINSNMKQYTVKQAVIESGEEIFLIRWFWNESVGSENTILVHLITELNNCAGPISWYKSA